MKLLVLWIIAYLAGGVVQSARFEYGDSSLYDSASSEEDEPKIWALLVAGSNGYYNYRHQADICHAFHILRNHGIPEENIVTMMYDDIANDPQNPYPGKLFSNPAGKDVYKGVEIDYSGESVTPSNFLAILSGNKSGVDGGNGRVLESTSQDKIFVFFADHGATGIIAFPDEMLTVKDLSTMLKKMHADNKFAELTFYLEACESGSMFKDHLPAELKIYAVTAANSHESSWGCYCDTPLNLPCLGDLFSVNWMEDSDREDLRSETLHKQFDLVKQLTNKSHVCHFGNKDIWQEPVADFQGDKSYRRHYSRGVKVSPHDYAMWPSRDVPLLFLKSQRDRAENEVISGQLSHQIHVLQKKRRFLESEISNLVKTIVHDPINQKEVMTLYPQSLTQLDCHHSLVHAFHRICFNVSENPYALKYVYVLANLCEMRIDTEHLIQKLMDHCVDMEKITGIH